MGKTSYCKNWEEIYTWLIPVNTDMFSFQIDNSGFSQVKSHEKCQKSGQALSNQRKFEMGQKGQISLSKSLFVVTPEDQVAKAETLQTLLW